MNTYFKFKLATEYIMPLCIVALIVIMVLSRGIKETIREFRIKKFFESHGYERKLLDVAGFGDAEFYGWNGWIRQVDKSKQITGRVVNDRELIVLPLKVIKELYK